MTCTYEAVRVVVIGAENACGPTRNAYDPAKSMRVNDNFVTAKFCFLKISYGSVHSDSEFYYRGELSEGRQNYFSCQLTRKLQEDNQLSSQMKKEPKWSYNKMLIDSRSVRTDPAAFGPYVLTSSQIFSRPALPLS